MTEQSAKRTPIWFTILCIAMALPVLSLPWVINTITDENALLVKLWPVYAVGAAYLAWTCYTQRQSVSWILIILILLSHAAIIALTMLS